MKLLIEYTVISTSGSTIKKGTVRSKLAETEFLAKVRFEDYCKQKYPDFGKLIIHSCKKEDLFDLPGWNEIFGNIFK